METAFIVIMLVVFLVWGDTVDLIREYIHRKDK